MSKARLIITAVVVEGRSQAEVARSYGVSKGWVSKLVARYRAEGEAAFDPRSRRPNRSPNQTSSEIVDLILHLRGELSERGLDAGADTIVWHLQHHHGIRISSATVWRCLKGHGLIEPQPKKRPKSSYIRFEAALPNEMWQADFTHWPLADGSDSEILTFLDDHSRYALTVTAHHRVTGPIVLKKFRAAISQYGQPVSTLTDNGMVFTTRLAGGRGGRNSFEAELARHGIIQKNTRPNHPTTIGKVERFQQTLKQWLRSQPSAATLTDLQAHLDVFADIYNNHRPHRSLGRTTPAIVYTRLPKATPNSQPANHYRIRQDIIGDNGVITLRHAGRLHHIGIGRTHARTPVILLIADLDVRIINATTGELLRQLTLDPTRNYQPQHKENP
jgi:transposase InsO family protein